MSENNKLPVWMQVVILIVTTAVIFYTGIAIYEKGFEDGALDCKEEYPRYYQFDEGVKIITDNKLEEVDCGINIIGSETNNYSCYKQDVLSLDGEQK